MNKTTLNSQKEKHSLLSLRRATFVGLAAHRLRNISIHALLAESDTSQPHCAGSFAISIHALLAESDPIISSATSCRWLFLSTLSLRRATCAPVAAIGHRLRISIHALLAESDLCARGRDRAPAADFYPRSPCGERPFFHQLCRRFCNISIHALLAESDTLSRQAYSLWCNFYPRSPCGERPTAMLLTFLSVKFLSTLSLRRATHVCCALAFFFLYFYPRSPCGERQTSLMLPCRALIFLSTLSLRRATVAAIASTFTFPLFLSTLSLRRATLLLSLSFCPLVNFYPRSPCGERPATPRAGR